MAIKIIGGCCGCDGGGGEPVGTCESCEITSNMGLVLTRVEDGAEFPMEWRTITTNIFGPVVEWGPAYVAELDFSTGSDGVPDLIVILESNGDGTINCYNGRHMIWGHNAIYNTDGYGQSGITQNWGGYESCDPFLMSTASSFKSGPGGTSGQGYTATV